MSTELTAAAGAAPAAPAPFDLEAAWQVSELVSIRPERFGAMLYHFGNRRLSFLKNRTLFAVLQGLATADSARAACLAAGLTEADLPVYRTALAALAASDMIRERTDPQ
ncbi:mycofactocin biosynthesis chaperone MftB [Nocardia sp. alder85J]|uniref:mycofactocin biosynthesis chaperone MftB n=1 Tax=Nocardia sp. alder85J TaxID=2862949 RepID=UPI001CD403E4|nr:mycofactocin biosynthesis chaperone MftB [Nocardia sp. alder85J]MCX4090825.1 mycofactocin biosynthesis chaperone MftB [Nocardia sp. alder85J]